MATKSSVEQHARAALGSRDTNAKLDHIARAIVELADFIDDIENAIRRLPTR